MKHIEKGSYGYIDAHKKRQLCKTILFFLLPVGIFLTGYFTTGSRENYFTIVAVVGSLPACKELVNVLMFARRNSIPYELYEKIASHTEGLDTLYELALTTYEATYSLPAVVISGNTVAGYSPTRNVPAGKLKEHIRKALEQNGISHTEVQIFGERKAFLECVDTLRMQKKADGREDAIRNVILTLSI